MCPIMIMYGFHEFPNIHPFLTWSGVDVTQPDSLGRTQKGGVDTNPRHDDGFPLFHNSVVDWNMDTICEL